MRFEDLRDRLAWLAMVGVILGSGAALRAQEPGPDGKPPEDVLFFFSEGHQGPDGKVHASDHWIGISGDAADEVLRAQLKLPAGQGYVVTQVQPDSPAAKAKVEKNDLLLSVGDKNIGELPDLVAVIEGNKDKELEFTLLRGGERRTLKVTPAKRPEAASPGDQPDVGHAFEDWIGRMPVGPERRMRLFNFGPGMVWNDGGFFVEKAEFPKDLTVNITKEGNATAKIVVKQGDKEWTTTDDKLEALPEEVRSHVSGLLGRPQFTVNQNAWHWNAPAPGPGGPGRHTRIEAFPRPQQRMRFRTLEVNERLDSLSKQLEDLRQSLDELREEPSAESEAKADDK